MLSDVGRVASRPRSRGGTATSVSGTCYGMCPTTPGLGLQFLRDGPGVPLSLSFDETEPARLGSLIMELPPTPTRPARARLHGDDSTYQWWVEGIGWFHVDTSGGAIVAPATLDPVLREERIWGMPALLCWTHLGEVPLHAAAVEIDGAAVLLAGPAYIGKTTLAAAFLGSGHRVLAEDTSCILMVPTPAVRPGPAVLRLRPDVDPAIVGSHGHVVRQDERGWHVAHSPGLRGQADPVQIRAIVLMREGHETYGLQPVDGLQVLPELWTLSFRLPGRAFCEDRFKNLAALAHAVPVFELWRPSGLTRLRETVDALVEGMAGHTA